MPRREPARGSTELPASIGYFRLQKLQELPHRGIGHRTCQLPIGHHVQDMEIFDANDPQVRASSVVNLCCTSRRMLAICYRFLFRFVRLVLLLPLFPPAG